MQLQPEHLRPVQLRPVQLRLVHSWPVQLQLWPE